MFLISAKSRCLQKAGHGSNKRPVCSNKLCLLLGTYSFYSPFLLDYTFIELRQNEPAKKHIKKSSIKWQVNSGLFQNPMNLIFEGKEKTEQTCLEIYPVQFLKILVEAFPPFWLIPAPRCRGGRFFWQLQLFGRRVLPAPPIAGCQPSRGEAERWASPINEGDKLTTNLGRSGKKMTGRHRRRWYIVKQSA